MRRTNTVIAIGSMLVGKVSISKLREFMTKNDNFERKITKKILIRSFCPPSFYELSLKMEPPLYFLTGLRFTSFYDKEPLILSSVSLYYFLYMI